MCITFKPAAVEEGMEYECSKHTQDMAQLQKSKIDFTLSVNILPLLFQYFWYFHPPHSSLIAVTII